MAFSLLYNTMMWAFNLQSNTKILPFSLTLITKTLLSSPTFNTKRFQYNLAFSLLLIKWPSSMSPWDKSITTNSNKNYSNRIQLATSSSRPNNNKDKRKGSW